MTVWIYQRQIEDLHIEIERLEKKEREKQNDFQMATHRGDEPLARQTRQEQLRLNDQIRQLKSELIQTERALWKAQQMEQIN
ncbi:hypothetical protein SAMN04487866_10846 [Thermoactinomyces sp. DSM 45891]|uniref:hypothetical protein n=1 Tax=Thermoactinomyces sp. DSM 45891 TaxID=1761907 RepID=UPI00090F72C1|nr:hypothetical protein [Thermoactinomyces sp. DSM 45891]SFX44992.1 hypothetical protein SAMN04487866_10846 [Thermoactinomyces sp. DSM 45891]